MQQTPRRKSYMLEDVRFLYRNFSGRQTHYNMEGARNTNVILNDQQAEELASCGFNVKSKPPTDEYETPLHTLKLNLGYKGNQPPRVYLIADRGDEPSVRTELSEQDVSLLDYVTVLKVDVSFNEYTNPKVPNAMKSAYVRALYVTIQEDPLDRKYADVTTRGALESVLDQGDILDTSL